MRSYEDSLAKIHGSDNNIYIAQFLSLKARKMQMQPSINQEETLAVLQRAIDIHEEVEKERPKKS
jgi:hypothetical protein